MNWTTLLKAIGSTTLASMVGAYVFAVLHTAYTQDSWPLFILFICSVFVAVLWEFYYYYRVRELDKRWVEDRMQYHRTWPKEDR